LRPRRSFVPPTWGSSSFSLRGKTAAAYARHACRISWMVEAWIWRSVSPSTVESDLGQAVFGIESRVPPYAGVVWIVAWGLRLG
jgi:hypothetical protein